MNKVYLYKNFSLIKLDPDFLLANPQTLRELAILYCNTWTYDPNFREFMVCTECGGYYSKEVVGNMKESVCFGHNFSHSKTALVRTWLPNNVIENDLIGDFKKYKRKICGYYAIENDTQIIVGFSWARIETKKDIFNKWGAHISKRLGNSDASYYSDIGVKDELRKTGLGKELCNVIVTWIKKTAPNIPSFLRTHQKSMAVNVFSGAGYRYFADDPEHGDGRIMMMIEKGKDLVP